MFKLPQTQRFMKFLAIVEAIAILILLCAVPELFPMFLIVGVLIWVGIAVMLRVFEWICTGK